MANSWKYFVQGFQKAFVVEGRTNRSQYWLFYLMVLLIALPIILMILFGSEPVSQIGTTLKTIFQLILIIPSTTLGIRRMHDINKSGWWLLPIFVPFIGIIYFVIMSIRPGTKGDNRFGPQP